MMPEARTLSRRYAQLHLPVTIVAGTDDKVVDLEAHARRLQLDLPNARLIVIPGLGHMAHYAAQEEIAAATAIDTPVAGVSAPSRSTQVPALETASPGA